MPWCTAVRTTARTAGFMPPASPPLVSTAMLEGTVAEGAVAVSVMKEVKVRTCPVTQSYCDDFRHVLYVSKDLPTAGLLVRLPSDGCGRLARIREAGRADKAPARESRGRPI